MRIHFADGRSGHLNPSPSMIGDNGAVTEQPTTSQQAATSPPQGSPPQGSRPQATEPERVGVRQQVSSYAQGSVANMLRSILVIGAIMALFVILVPRLQPDHSGVDVVETARQLQESAGLPVSAPADLPDGWVATRAEYRRGADDLMTWHALYETPSGGVVALNQTAAATDTWVRQTVNRTERTGEVDLDGTTWQQHEREGTRPQRSFVDQRDGDLLSTVVTGDAPWDDLETFVRSLRPAGSGS